MRRRIRWQLVDRVAAPAIAAGCAVELAVAAHGAAQAAGLAASSVVGIVPLAWRRRFPLGTCAWFFLISTSASAAFGHVRAGNIILAAVLMACYAPGAYADRRRALAGLGIVVAGMAAIELTFSPSVQLGEIVWVTLMGGAIWLGGRTVRSRTRLTEELHEDALRAEEEREAEAARAVADERRRIAREMHDVVAHSVSVMVVQAGGARRILELDPGRAEEAAARVEDTGRAALLEMRRLLGILHAGEGEAHLAPQPTLDALEALVEGARAAGHPVALTVEGDRRPLPPGVDLAAYRVVQEALTNAMKHAGAAPTTVRVRYRPDELELEVADRGAGHAPRRRHGDHEIPGGGHGLVGMRERVRLFGGDLFTGRSRGGGFEVRARIPVTGEEEIA